ncbi:MAG: hypothetical protein LBB84_06820 [Tannerellaceae bacterium]|jgi:hypothetical protein|nr:hypothetical protein [Tannerellaceae bacterium]
MIKQIFKQIWTERRRNLWLLLELTVVYFFLLVMADFLWIRLKNYTEPLGFDIENTFLLKLKLLEPKAAAYVAPENTTASLPEQIAALTDRIRRYPDVETLSLSIFASPYPHGGYWNELRSDTTVRGEIMQGRNVTPDYFDVMRIRTPKGEPLRVENREEILSIVVTEDVALKYFGSAEAAIGQVMYSENSLEPLRVAAVCSYFKNQEFEPYRPNFFDVMSPVKMEEHFERIDLSSIDLLVRVHPGRANHFAGNFKEEMGELLQVDNLYVSSVVPSSQLRDGVVGQALRGEIRQMGYVSLFVLITVCLGVFGTFWLRTWQRRGETGIRMAMGASSATIRRWLVAEGLCLMAIALPPALLVYFNLLSAEVLDVWRLPFNVTRVGVATFASTCVMGVVILGGVLQPARRASALSPAEALQYE